MRRFFVLFLLLSQICCTHHAAAPDDTLVVALGAQPATLDPRYATDANGMRIGALIFSSLVRLGPNLEPLPDAAERWTYQKHSYTFYLRRDLKFHNGRAVNRDDVEFSFNQFLNKGGAFSSVLDLIQNVAVSVADDQLVVRIDLRSDSDKFLRGDLPSIKLLPRAELLAAGNDFSQQLIGTGGFKFVRQNANEIELAGVTARMPHLIFKIIRDDFTRYQKMLKGEVDLTQMEIAPDKVADFKKRPREFQVFLYPGLSMAYLLVNFKEPLLKNPEVRRALAQSIQRADIIRYKMAGLASEATSLMTPNNPYYNPRLKNPPYDPAAAARLIDQLGLQGQELILKTSNAPQAVDNGKVLAYQMAQSGLKVGLQSYEWGTFYNDVKHGNFQLAVMRWVATVDPGIYRLAFHSSEKPPGRNRGSYSNLDLDKLLDEGTASENPAQRKVIFLKVQEIVQNDLAVIPLWYDQQIAIAKINVRNYAPNQTGDFWPLLEVYKTHE